MDTVKRMVVSWGITGDTVRDASKLIVIGGAAETIRPALTAAWYGLINSLYLTANFSQGDSAFEWIMHWLSKQPAWARSRNVDIMSRAPGGNALSWAISDPDQGDGLHSRGKFVLMPAIDVRHSIAYRGHWLRITRSRDGGNFVEKLTISVLALNHSILRTLVVDAKKAYEEDKQQSIQIFVADSNGLWCWNCARQQRPMSSIILKPGVKENLVGDCKDFLGSRAWYAERGIPFRRGYLLHGVPGSGKTSVVHALAGELGLDIYMVSLSAPGMSDARLHTLLSRMPSNCILLLEDLDAAFTRDISREATYTGSPPPGMAATLKAKNEVLQNNENTLSLSGLLNAIDGITAAEGRLLFITTNHVELLDPALSRPGRMDVIIQFSNATKSQAEGIFNCFFSSPSGRTSSARHNAPTGSVSPWPSDTEMCTLAKSFADAIPEGKMTTAALQGYLLRNRTSPRESIINVAAWVADELEGQARRDGKSGTESHSKEDAVNADN